jgi:hypothetical protein
MRPARRRGVAARAGVPVAAPASAAAIVPATGALISPASMRRRFGEWSFIVGLPVVRAGAY